MEMYKNTIIELKIELMCGLRQWHVAKYFFKNMLIRAILSRIFRLTLLLPGKRESEREDKSDFCPKNLQGGRRRKKKISQNLR